MVSESETTDGETESESAAIPESISAQDEDEKDFGTIRAFFDKDEHFEDDEYGVIIVIIGKMYDHIVKLYGGGGERQPEYEKVLRTIKAFYSSNDKYDCELIKEAEMTLMRIATGKTNTETEGLTLIVKDKSDYYCDEWDYQDLRALRALLDHVVKMDEGNCSSRYKSLFSFIYNTIDEPYNWTSDVGWRRKRVKEVVRKLGAIENRKKEGARDATKDDESAASPDSILAQDEDKKDFGTIRAFFDEDEHFNGNEDGVIIVIIGKMYDHMLKLYDGGGERQPEYKKLLRTIRAFYSSNDEDDYPYHPRELTEKAEMTIIKTNTETEGLTLIIMDDYFFNKWNFPLVKILWALFDHVIEMDEGNCSSHYISLLSFICNTIHKDRTWTSDYVVNWRRMTVEVVVRMLGDIENRKRKGAREEEVIVDNATTNDETYCFIGDGTADVRLPIQPRHSWLKPSEILLKLQNFKISEMSEEIQQKPPSGSLILYDTKATSHYKKDGYNWKKLKDGKTVTENHTELKVEGHNKLHGHYDHSIDDHKFHRRTYFLRNKISSIRLVHYLVVNYNDKREKSVGTSSRTKKRPRRDSDGDDINKENGNQVHFPQNANRVISTNTSSLDDEMVLLSKEVESLPGFERGSDWFVSAMLSFKDKDHKAIFKAVGDRNSKVKLLKMILNL